MKPKLFRAIGLMSGTSIDGIDAALMETDGVGFVRPLGFESCSYDKLFRAKLRRLFGAKNSAKDPEFLAIEHELTALHAASVGRLLAKTKDTAGTIDVIGFHGQTLFHQPSEGITQQMGDGELLAQKTGIPVVNDFRSADIKAGGQGAPLVPLYHRALAAQLPKPVAILNVGGVANITWIGGDGDDAILAFDVGPGNAPLDDWVLHHTDQAFDKDGALAAAGQVHPEAIKKFIGHSFFAAKPPKSLDRGTFRNLVPENISPADGAATITHMIALGVTQSLKFLPTEPHHIYVAGGGRLNNTLMRHMMDVMDIPVSAVDKLGWSGDALEAEAFAYLAVRSCLGLPLSVPGTTGVAEPVTGGTLHRP